MPSRVRKRTGRRHGEHRHRRNRPCTYPSHCRSQAAMGSVSRARLASCATHSSDFVCGRRLVHLLGAGKVFDVPSMVAVVQQEPTKDGRIPITSVTDPLADGGWEAGAGANQQQQTACTSDCRVPDAQHCHDALHRTPIRPTSGGAGAGPIAVAVISRPKLCACRVLSWHWPACMDQLPQPQPSAWQAGRGGQSGGTRWRSLSGSLWVQKPGASARDAR